mmetsp:Transcript_27630/g.65146  ORF Transcript_27630/g.65146 Transcript_27630/m.65146 type:complete len:218 (+) Transcript_27630:420-1073(+)
MFTRTGGPPHAHPTWAHARTSSGAPRCDPAAAGRSAGGCVHGAGGAERGAVREVQRRAHRLDPRDAGGTGRGYERRRRRGGRRRRRRHGGGASEGLRSHGATQRFQLRAGRSGHPKHPRHAARVATPLRRAQMQVLGRGVCRAGAHVCKHQRDVCDQQPCKAPLRPAPHPRDRARLSLRALAAANGLGERKAPPVPQGRSGRWRGESDPGRRCHERC